MVLTAEKMPTGKISSLTPSFVPQREEYSFSEKNKTEKTKPTSENIFEDFSSKELALAGSLAGSLMSEKQLEAYYKDDLEEMLVIADKAKMWYEKNFYDPLRPNENNPEAFRSGFLAETATIITLREMQLEVFKATPEDDTEGCIDLFFKVNYTGENAICPAQIKSKSSINKPVVVPLNNPDNLSRDWFIEKLVNSPKTEKDIKEEVGQIGTKMLQYLRENREDIKKDFTNLKIKPVIIFVPGGQSEYAVYNSRLGTPDNNNYYNKLVDEFFNVKIWE